MKREKMKGSFNSHEGTARKAEFQNSVVGSSSCPKEKLDLGLWASCLEASNGIAAQGSTAVFAPDKL